MLRDMLLKIVRSKQPILFQDLLRTEPVSRIFGLDRGTPVDRYYIERFLAGHRDLIKGRVLEVGGSDYSRRFGAEKVAAFEVLHAVDDGSATIVGDLTDPSTLPEGSMDCFICTQTFNFIFDLQKAVEGAHHLLKPGGVLLATVAGISQISRYDMDRWGDFWRFTQASLQKLFTPVFAGGVDIESHGNALAACSFLQGLAVEDLPDGSLLDTRDPDYQMLLTIVARKGA